MKDRWIISRAHPGQGAEIARLVRASLPPHLRRFTIWDSPDICSRVESILGGARAAEAHEFYLARQRSGAAAAVAAFRLLDGQAFLNHLYVAPRFRGRGLGRQLLTTACRRYLARHPARRIALDVFSGAHPAEGWYARLGFEERRQRVWRARRAADSRPGWNKLAVSRRLECAAQVFTAGSL
ncbi:MAG: GNAT family N-acetyltransferase [Acidobacteria bacterium]|nr:GNAT family N-acetyltransferase [Acidobacteriota bacterium]